MTPYQSSIYLSIFGTSSSSYEELSSDDEAVEWQSHVMDAVMQCNR